MEVLIELPSPGTRWHPLDVRKPSTPAPAVEGQLPATKSHDVDATAPRANVARRQTGGEQDRAHTCLLPNALPDAL